MLLSKYVELKWNSRNKNRYINLGYEYTKMGDSFYARISDITDGCSATVFCICDYCGKIYTTKWQCYVKRNNNQKDCCQDVNCIEEKAKESIYDKYGTNSILDVDSIKDKISKTNIKKYGFSNPFQSQYIKEKIKKSNIEKYGYASPMKNDSVKNKAKNTCIEKYGVDNYAKTNEFKDSFSGENNPMWKGGVQYHGVERSTKEYTYWRLQVFQRDQFTCQVCGQNGGTLNAHHIFNWRDNEDLRYDVDNGVCLCEKCHILFHKIYKKRNNNKEQLLEFIKSRKKDMLNYCEQEAIEIQDKKPI